MDNIYEIIDEVIYEMQNGIVDADVILLMKMHNKYSSHFEITPTINLNNKEVLYSKIKEYIFLFNNTIGILSQDVKDKYIKRLIALLFADMSINDFENPILYIQRKIDFVNDKFLEDRIIDYIPFFESRISINVKPYGKETPYCFNCTLEDYNLKYVVPQRYELPTISYGISEGICYIYAIQDYNKHIKTPYHSKIKKKLYKLNSGVYNDETKEYKDYKEGKIKYYPENISDVSPSAVLSLIIFLNEIHKKGITNIRVIPYLPIRYENKIKELAKKTIEETKVNNLTKQQERELYLEVVKKFTLIQSNITEKFIRTFYRAAYHFDNIKITSLPMELDDSLHITLSEFSYGNNEILNEIINISNKNLSK